MCFRFRSYWCTGLRRTAFISPDVIRGFTAKDLSDVPERFHLVRLLKLGFKMPDIAFVLNKKLIRRALRAPAGRTLPVGVGFPVDPLTDFGSTPPPEFSLSPASGDDPDSDNSLPHLSDEELGDLSVTLDLLPPA